jgi:hypothetical protein
MLQSNMGPVFRTWSASRRRTAAWWQLSFSRGDVGGKNETADRLFQQMRTDDVEIAKQRIARPKVVADRPRLTEQPVDDVDARAGNAKCKDQANPHFVEIELGRSFPHELPGGSCHGKATKAVPFLARGKLTNRDVSQIKVGRAIPDHIDVPGWGSCLRNRRGCGIIRT